MSRTMEELNLTALEIMSRYLNAHPRFIATGDVEEIAACGVTREDAVRLLFASACGVEEDRVLCERYIRPSLKRLDAVAYRQNPYLQAIRFPETRLGGWQMTHLAYAPYELFVRDDLLITEDGREIPQLGYFEEPFTYPAVLQDGREWMTVTPNEIATMQSAVDAAHGHVVAMGLGLGYFAFMASGKEGVTHVTVVERDEAVISLFKRHILPQFPHGKKIEIVQADAFDYARRTLPDVRADMCFVDLWHDTLDGAPLYLRMKKLESCAPDTQFIYWVETAIQSFLRGIV